MTFARLANSRGKSEHSDIDKHRSTKDRTGQYYVREIKREGKGQGRREGQSDKHKQVIDRD